MTRDDKVDERAERLAAALRANLRKRKAQARGSAEPGGGGKDGGGQADDRDRP